jgi:hypothetical protein
MEPSMDSTTIQKENLFGFIYPSLSYPAEESTFLIGKSGVKQRPISGGSLATRGGHEI